MLSLPEIFGGLDRPSLFVGLFLGILFTMCLGKTYFEWKWTFGMLKRPLGAQQEVREINKESWETFRTGSRVGCARVVFYGVLAVLFAWFIANVVQMSQP
jgi:hypothetical protein